MNRYWRSLALWTLTLVGVYLLLITFDERCASTTTNLPAMCRE
jgi:hypothetical protein